MKNSEIAEILNEIADYLEFQAETFKVRAYRKAALSVESLSEDIEEFWKQGRLREISGVGEAISEKISEFLGTGKVRYLQELEKETPVNLAELGRIEGVGPKTIFKLYQNLGVKNIKDLEKAAKSGKIRSLAGFGETTEKNILKSIEFSKKAGKRMPLGYALPIAEEILARLKTIKSVQKAEIAGSARRMKETIGDIDILATSSKAKEVINFFIKMPNVADVLASGETKASVRLHEGIQADLRVIPDRIFGAGLLYFSGGKEHNIIMRKLAIQKGWKLSEYGLFDSKDKLLAGKTEEEIYNKLGLQYIPPELREDEGEIDAARNGKIPKLIEYNDIKGDLQIQTKWSDGSSSIEDYAQEAKKLGYEYICITDHVGKLAIANALDERRLKEQRKEIDELNEKLSGIKILQGCEVNITSSGSLDMPDSALKELDVVLAAIHSGFKNSGEQITNRIIKAMENEHVDILAHPTGRLLTRREAYEIDMGKVIEQAKATGTILEINAFPERMDLKDVHVRQAVKAGVKLIINTDAHSVEHLRFMRLGIGTARRGWASREDVINTRSLKEMMKLFK